MKKHLKETHAFDGVSLKVCIHKETHRRFQGTIIELPIIMVEADTISKVYEKLEASFKYYINHTLFPLLCDIGLEYDLKQRWLIKGK
jgi:hypothetical protein